MNAEELRLLGWKPAFRRQMTAEDEKNRLIARVGAHLGSQIMCLCGSDPIPVPVSMTVSCGELAVGDWILLDPETHRALRRLERESLVTRKAAGASAKTQLIAANLDTLLIVTSCNHDFNPSRLERYLALAADAKVNPVVVLTKADLCDDTVPFRRAATELKSGLIVEVVDARRPADLEVLSDWCRLGQTVALVGSSGVGKSTLAMTLGAPELETQGIREDDSKGRHTTTARWIHQLDAGGVLIDTPGMRELQLADCEDGVAEVFHDIVALSESCRFSDCQHESEPGCAVQVAIAAGEMEPRRLNNYRKLQSEQSRNAKSIRERRHDSRKQGRFYKSVLSAKRRSNDLR